MVAPFCVSSMLVMLLRSDCFASFVILNVLNGESRLKMRDFVFMCYR